MSPSTSTRNLRDVTNRRVAEIDKIIDNVTKSVMEIASHRSRSTLVDSLSLARLRRERLRAMTAVARAQAIVAEMEILIAENELSCELGNLKRKTPATYKQTSSSKKAKISENNAQESGSKQHTSKQTRKANKNSLPPKISPKPNHMVATDIPLEGSKQDNAMNTKKDQIPQENNNENNKTLDCNNNDKVNGPLSLKKGKQIIIISNPPFRNGLTGENTGYVTTAYPMNLSHSFTNHNSIYNHSNDSENSCLLQKELPALVNYNFISNEEANKHLAGYLLTDAMDSDKIFSNFKLKNCLNCSVKEQNCCCDKDTSSVLVKGESLGNNDHLHADNTTNQLFREMLSNSKSIKVEEDVHSLSSSSTFIICEN